MKTRLENILNLVDWLGYRAGRRPAGINNANFKRSKSIWLPIPTTDVTATFDIIYHLHHHFSPLIPLCNSVTQFLKNNFVTIFLYSTSD